MADPCQPVYKAYNLLNYSLLSVTYHVESEDFLYAQEDQLLLVVPWKSGRTNTGTILPQSLQ